MKSVFILPAISSFMRITSATFCRNPEKVDGEGAVIVDVRSKKEFAAGHAAGAVNIPLADLPGNKILADRGQTVIVCCSQGIESMRAFELLKAAGYKKVFNGGNWRELESFIGNHPDAVHELMMLAG